MPRDYKIRHLDVHDGGITCAHMEQNIIATGSYDRSVRLLDLDTMQPVSTLWGHKKAARCVQVVGSVVISGSNDHTIRLWNGRSGEMIHELNGHKGAVTGLQFLEDGYLMRYIFCGNYESCNTALKKSISGSQDNTIKVWDLHSGECYDTFRQTGMPFQHHSTRLHYVGPIECFRVVGDKVVVATRGGHFSNTLFVLDHNTGERIQTFENGHWVKSCLFDGKQLVTGHYFPHVIKTWDMSTGRCTAEMYGHTGPVCGLQFQNSFLLSVAKEDCIRVWSTEQRVCVRTLDEQKYVSGLQFHSGRLVSWSDLNGSLSLWERVQPHMQTEHQAPQPLQQAQILAQ